jgi:IS5 family transposase
VLALTGQTGELLAASAREARSLAAEAAGQAKRLARSGSAKTRGAATRIVQAIEFLEELTSRCETLVTQIKKRLAGEPISDRLISLFDPDARPIRKGRLGKKPSSAISSSWPK